tara:strand:+ start:2159 stop:2425 length:267 start_codon:yes stop_codon:yes gene_type:complete
MKTIVDNATNTSRYLLADDKAVTMGADSITVGDPEEFIISDLNSGNATLIENVIEPADWFGTKYTHDGTAWAAVEGWVAVDPSEEQEE